MKIAEPDVTFSDFALSLESLVLAVLMASLSAADRPIQELFTVFFVAIMAASFCGGLVHGFLTTPHSRSQDWVWRAALVALGGAAVTSWTIAAWVVLPQPWTGVVIAGALILYLVYIFIIVHVQDDYRVAIVHYVPALLAMAFTFFHVWILNRSPMLLVGVGGIMLSFIAGVMQQKRIAIHPVYFSHNALYHLNQGIALFAIFLGARSLMPGA